jgi:hypothetical protein
VLRKPIADRELVDEVRLALATPAAHTRRDEAPRDLALPGASEETRRQQVRYLREKAERLRDVAKQDQTALAPRLLGLASEFEAKATAIEAEEGPVREGEIHPKEGQRLQ